MNFLFRFVISFLPGSCLPNFVTLAVWPGYQFNIQNIFQTMDNEMMRYGLSPYESWKISERTSRRPSGTAVAGLVLGSVGAVAAVGAWVFGPVVAGNRAKGIEKVIDITNANTQSTLDRLINALASERAERVAQGVTLTQTVTDTVSGSQQGTLTAQQASELSAVNSVMQQTFSDAITGRSSLNPTPVSIYSAPQPCGCPCGN